MLDRAQLNQTYTIAILNEWDSDAQKFDKLVELRDPTEEQITALEALLRTLSYGSQLTVVVNTRSVKSTKLVVGPDRPVEEAPSE